ncbi:MAG TPA: hypothetical protein PKG85_05145 [Mesotoga infera]|nr:hypothetical protein [Mesotoga infera]
MYSDSTPSRNRGFVLAVTLIIMIFATTMIVAASIIIQRTSRRLNEYSLLSDLRVASNNLVEGAAMILARKWNQDNFNSSWDGFEDFVQFVSSRGGYEGDLWSEVIQSLDSERWWLINEDEDFASLLEDASFSELTSMGAAVNLTGGKYSIVSWAEKAGVKRYSYGLVLAESLLEHAALRFGDISRVFYEVTTGEKNKDDILTGRGDVINGQAIVIGGVAVSDSNINLELVFPYGLTAKSITPDGSYTYTQTASDSEQYFSDLLADHEDWLASLSPVATYTAPFNNVITASEEGLIVFKPNDSSGSPYTIYFPDVAGSDHRYLTIKYKNDSGVFTTKIYAGDFPVNIAIHGNLLVGDAESDPLKLHYINGQYNITVYGSITVNYQLMYGDFADEFDDARTQGGKVSNQEINTWSKIKELLNDFSERETGDHLSLVSIGGDIINTYVIGNSGKGTHAIRALAGEFSAFKKNGTGGAFTFPDLGTVVKNERTKLGQLFFFGSITGNRFGTVEEMNYLDNLFVSSTRGITGGTFGKRLILAGLRAW